MKFIKIYLYKYKYYIHKKYFYQKNDCYTNIN